MTARCDRKQMTALDVRTVSPFSTRDDELNRVLPSLPSPISPLAGPTTIHSMSVLLETSLGDVVIDLEVDACPELSENFLKVRSSSTRGHHRAYR